MPHESPVPWGTMLMVGHAADDRARGGAANGPSPRRFANARRCFRACPRRARQSLRGTTYCSESSSG
eukprot:6685692-Alexandrium_andersonii.AAC.1